MWLFRTFKFTKKILKNCLSILKHVFLARCWASASHYLCISSIGFAFWDKDSEGIWTNADPLSLRASQLTFRPQCICWQTQKLQDNKKRASDSKWEVFVSCDQPHLCMWTRQLSVDALRTLKRAEIYTFATHSLMAPSSTVQHTLLTPLLVQHQQLELENGRGSVSLHLTECESLVCVKTLKKRETWCLAEEQQTTVVKNAGGPMMGRWCETV